MADVSRSSVEAYLNNNPEFARAWFIQSVGTSSLEAWLTKFSSQKLLSPRPNSVQDVSRNSITSAMFHDLVSGKRKVSSSIRRNKEDLLKMSEIDLFMELIRDIANELDVNILCHKILLNVSILTKSDRGSLFLVRGSRDNRYLVSKLFDVTEHSSLDDSLHTEDQQIRVPFGRGIAGTVAEGKEVINIKDAYEDPRFNQDVDKKTGYRTKSILCMPILNYEGEVIGVAQIMNKCDSSGVFSPEDEEVFKNYLTFCGIGLTNAQLFEMSVQEFKRNQMLLGLARGIFEEQTNLDKLVQKIMLEAQELLKCERCSVYLLDDSADEAAAMEHLMTVSAQHRPNPKVSTTDTKAMMNASPARQPKVNDEELQFSKAFVMHADNQTSIINPKQEDLRKSKAAQMAQEVIATGTVKNVADASVDATKGQDQLKDYDGFVIRSLLALPIRNSNRKIIGVVQLVNKSNGKPFSEADINVCEAFAIFCGLGVHNCQMYESACKLMAKQSVALEVLSYHATAPQEDVDRLKNAVVKPANEYKLHTYEFNDFPLSEDDTCQATIRMFLDMGVVTEFHVSYEVLCRWVLSVKKNYRPVTYHNWRHGFNVAQTMFTMLHTGKMAKHMDKLEMFALIVACLCHDLDHRGTNNAFQSKADTPLAVLYGTSTMEHHHFDQCIMILNSSGNNILERLSADEYRRAISIVESAILATDLALYFKKKSGFESLVTKGETQWIDAEKKDLLRGMMMTACDVAAITKPWEVQKEVAQLVAGEFFEQGDMERNELNTEPIAMMDRQKKDELPKMQVGFIDAICVPVYKMFAQLKPELSPLYEGLIHNRSQWQSLADSNEDPNGTDNA